MMQSPDIERLLTQYRDRTEEFAVARATRTYLEEFRKSLVAILMKQSGEKSAAAQERDALAADQYQQLLKDLSTAVEEEEKLRYMVRKIEFEIEVWRTMRADERQERKAYAA